MAYLFFKEPSKNLKTYATSGQQVGYSGTDDKSDLIIASISIPKYMITSSTTWFSFDFLTSVEPIRDEIILDILFLFAFILES